MAGVRASGGGEAEITRQLTELEPMRPMTTLPSMAAATAATVFLIGAVESRGGALLVTRRALSHANGKPSS